MRSFARIVTRGATCTENVEDAVGAWSAEPAKVQRAEALRSSVAQTVAEPVASVIACPA